MNRPRLEQPWLVAAWPGMGGVAQIAASYLVQQLGAEQLEIVAAQDYFEQRAVTVKAGLIQPPQPVRNLFLGWENPGKGRDLVILMGEQQPSSQGHRLCDELLATAAGFHVERVFTFAAMASAMDVRAPAKVHVVANDAGLLDELRRPGVRALRDGEIGGLNGVLLAAAAARSLPGACLLGEMPFFATGIANPKASSAVLRVFTQLAGIALDLGELDRQAKALESHLAEQLQRLQQQFGGLAGGAEEPEFPTAYEREAEREEEEEKTERESPLDSAAEAHIEELFRAAAVDRDRALELKTELDRHGVFKRYEDRFLDLFKRAE